MRSGSLPGFCEGFARETVGHIFDVFAFVRWRGHIKAKTARVVEGHAAPVNEALIDPSACFGVAVGKAKGRPVVVPDQKRVDPPIGLEIHYPGTYVVASGVNFLEEDVSGCGVFQLGVLCCTYVASPRLSICAAGDRIGAETSGHAIGGAVIQADGPDIGVQRTVYYGGVFLCRMGRRGGIQDPRPRFVRDAAPNELTVMVLGERKPGMGQVPDVGSADRLFGPNPAACADQTEIHQQEARAAQKGENVCLRKGRS